VEEYGFSETAQESMSWAIADLLSWPSVQSCLQVFHERNVPPTAAKIEGDSMPIAMNSKFYIVIEKSTADAIACGDDVRIPIPYDVLSTGAKMSKVDGHTDYIHPVRLLAIHLAAAVQSGGYLIALSYSETRFDCLFNDGDEDDTMLQ
jgi:hypothetical protein